MLVDIVKQRNLKVFKEGKLSDVTDYMVVEKSLRIILNGHELVTLACSPEATEQLAVGYLLSEGLLNSREDIKSMQADDPLAVSIETFSQTTFPAGARKINTCMGKGGTGLPEPLPVDTEIPKLDPWHLLKLIHELDATSFTFQRTGGVHSAALGDSDTMLVRYEDIGRHNAVDKTLGHAVLEGIKLQDKVLLLSGRIASEILIKAARNRIPVIVSRSAPTLLAVELAEKLGLTVVGFARGQRFNVYAHGERIKFD
ncbi:MAG: formate dehydrogenase accessory sulfurtransferase FdhD [Syntrophomonadaceae bacterium]|nr:formate dehydrogenase accessory sulfurtransferase FdhD [Syntrophomonadaceae bacterium]